MSFYTYFGSFGPHSRWVREKINKREPARFWWIKSKLQNFASLKWTNAGYVKGRSAIFVQRIFQNFRTRRYTTNFWLENLRCLSSLFKIPVPEFETRASRQSARVWKKEARAHLTSRACARAIVALIFSMNLPRERFWNTFESLVHHSIPCENLFYTGSIRVENSIWMNVKMLNEMNCTGLGWWARMVQYINIYIYAILWFEMGRMVFDWVCTY